MHKDKYYSLGIESDKDINNSSTKTTFFGNKFHNY